MHSAPAGRPVAQLPGLVESAVRHFGGLDILINNASTFYPTPIGEISLGQFEDLIGTNFRAPLFLARFALLAMVRIGDAAVVQHLTDAAAADISS